MRLEHTRKRYGSKKKWPKRCIWRIMPSWSRAGIARTNRGKTSRILLNNTVPSHQNAFLHMFFFDCLHFVGGLSSQLRAFSHRVVPVLLPILTVPFMDGVVFKREINPLLPSESLTTNLLTQGPFLLSTLQQTDSSSRTRANIMGWSFCGAILMTPILVPQIFISRRDGTGKLRKISPVRDFLLAAVT